MKFEDNLSKKIDMSKVKIDVLKPWITKRVYEMLKMEDDVVVEFIFNQLEDEKVCILIVIIRLNSVKNTNFGLYNQTSFLMDSKIVFGVTDHFCIK